MGESSAASTHVTCVEVSTFWRDKNSITSIHASAVMVINDASCFDTRDSDGALILFGTFVFQRLSLTQPCHYGHIIGSKQDIPIPHFLHFY
jgi:hypothetical protein